VSEPTGFVAECFWAGVNDADVRKMDEQIRAAVADLVVDGQLRYSGSLLMPTDEVVLFLFEGSEHQVRSAAERAGVPFDRIIPASTRSSHLPLTTSADTLREP
jgi:hypothetical protein